MIATVGGMAVLHSPTLSWGDVHIKAVDMRVAIHHVHIAMEDVRTEGAGNDASAPRWFRRVGAHHVVADVQI